MSEDVGMDDAMRDVWRRCVGRFRLSCGRRFGEM